MAETYRHEKPDSSGPRRARGGKCPHRDIAIAGARATCRDCKRTFLGW